MRRATAPHFSESAASSAAASPGVLGNDTDANSDSLAITANTDLRLCRFFGLSDGYWLRAQVAYDTEVAEDALAKTLQKIKPWQGIGARLGHTA